MNLYNFQTTILNKTVNRLIDKIPAVLTVAPTGSGKTVIMSELAKYYNQRGLRVLILVHRDFLLSQTLKALFETGLQAGQVASGRPLTKDLTTVAMVGTLVRRLNRVPRPDVILVDECHHTVSSTYLKILEHYNGVPIVGYSATPVRLDGKPLGDIFCEMIEAPDMSWMVSNGPEPNRRYLKYPVIYRPDSKYFDKKYHIKRGDYDRKEQDENFQQNKRAIVGDVIGHWEQYAKHIPTLGFCVSVRHAHDMASSFRDAGYSAIALDGSATERERKSALGGLADGTYNVLFSCDLIGEGLDVPVVGAGIFLRKTKSISLWRQQAGRTLRWDGLRANAVLLDHAGNSLESEHGHLLNPITWSLDEGVKKTGQDGKEVHTTYCPKCKGVWPGKPKVCPGYYGQAPCGFVFSEIEKRDAAQRKAPDVIAGELQQALPNVSKEDIAKMTNFVQQVQTLDSKTRNKALIKQFFETRDKERMRQIAKAVGYKDNWADVIYKRVISKG